MLEALDDYSMIQTLVSRNDEEPVGTQQTGEEFDVVSTIRWLVSTIRWLNTRSRAKGKDILGNMRHRLQGPSPVLAPSECLVPKHALMIDQRTLDILIWKQRWLSAINSDTDDRTLTSSTDGGTC